MRIAFLLALLAASLFYTYVAFADLAFLSRVGRLGPGFFPRLIGVGLIVTCLASLVSAMRSARADGFGSDYAIELGMVVLLSAGLVALLGILGGVLATAVFLLTSLSLLNRGRHIQNVVISVVLPAAIYLLFDVLLNASMPEGVLPFSI